MMRNSPVIKILCFIFTLFYFQLFAFAAFEFDVSYWRLSAFSASFDERINEADERTEMGSFEISSANIESGRPVWEIEGDGSKYLFDLSYQFEEDLHRFKVGYQYAGTGNMNVSEVSWRHQYKDLENVITDKHFSAKRFNYSNLYASYRVLPFISDNYSSNSVNDRGLDIFVSWTSLEINYTIDPFNATIGELPCKDVYTACIPVAFKTSTESIGFGVGGERRSENELFSISGRIIYLPFFDFNGNGWDAELKLSFEFSEYLSFYIGGKVIRMDLETEQTIENVAQVPGFSDSEATFKGLNIDMSGYTLGARYKF